MSNNNQLPNPGQQGLKIKLVNFNLGEKKKLSIEDKKKELDAIKNQQAFKSLTLLDEAKKYERNAIVFKNVSFSNTQDATYDNIKAWLDENKIHALNLMAVSYTSDTIYPGMYKGQGETIQRQAYFFPFVPIAFVTDKVGSFTPPKINMQDSKKKTAHALQAVSMILQGRAPWSTSKFVTVEVIRAMMMTSSVKLSTIIGIIKTQTIPVTQGGEMVFPDETKFNIKAAAVNPLDYVLASEVKKIRDTDKDWLDTKMEYKKLKMAMHVLALTEPAKVKDVLKGAMEKEVQIKDL